MHNEKYSIDSWIKLRKKLDFIPKNQPIFLNFEPDEFKIKQMTTYVLHDRMIIGNFSDDGYIENNLPISERIKSKENVHYQISIRKTKEELSLINDSVFVVTRYNK